MAQTGIGILGGGQLARMMALEAHRVGLTVKILSENPTDPAAQVVSSENWMKGDPNRLPDLIRFMKSVACVTFESEFFDSEAIEKASQGTQTPVHPSPRLMGLLQDRLSQKTLLDRYELPTSPWRAVNSAEDAVVAYVGFQGKVVFKKRRFGYDGYGTSIVRNEAELESFLKSMPSNPTGYIAERWIRFERELATVAIRSQDGKVQFYPLVESKQSDSRCLWVSGPIVTNSNLDLVQKNFATMLKEENYVGAIGLELFEDKSKTRSACPYLINELAPRVHNTGHYTLDAFAQSQFLTHLQCVMGESVAELRPTAQAFAMWNLIGSELNSNAPTAMVENSAWTRLHWYGKSEARPGRKMGHINSMVGGSMVPGSARSMNTARATALKLAKKHAAKLVRMSLTRKKGR